MIIKDFEIPVSEGELLRTTAYGTENRENPCIIFVHGFKGFKDWGFGPYLARFFADRGYFVLTFNFSHNGTGESLTDFTEPEKFAANTYSREVNELSSLIDAYRNQVFGNIKSSEIGLIGHSRGGAIAILTAAFRREVKAAALWASISRLDRYSERQKKEWRRKGFMEVKNQRTGQVMKLNESLLDDIENNRSGILNIENAVKSFSRPLLIAHGEQDLAVPKSEAEELYSWSDKSKTEYFSLHATGHTFDIKHPFEGTNEKFERLLEKTESFFRNNLQFK